MDEELQYFISWNGGKGTNSSAEARALAGLLAFCIFFSIQAISILGDSNTMIDHVNGTCHIKNPLLVGWMDRIMLFSGLLRGCSIQHIYRAQNQQANNLWKEGLLLDSSAWSMKVIYGEFSCFIQDFSIPGSWFSFGFTLIHLFVLILVYDRLYGCPTFLNPDLILPMFMHAMHVMHKCRVYVFHVLVFWNSSGVFSLYIKELYLQFMFSWSRSSCF